jgi:hypothetical protein
MNHENSGARFNLRPPCNCGQGIDLASSFQFAFASIASGAEHRYLSSQFRLSTVQVCQIWTPKHGSSVREALYA